jgi:hypothetical protein
MRPVVVVVVLPLPHLLVHEVDVVADAAFVEEPVELVVVDAVRPLDFAVQARSARPDPDVANVEFFQVPVELRAELGAVVRLHELDAERQAANDLVGEVDRRRLVARVVNLEHPNARAVIDGRELVEALLRPGDALEELYVHLQTVTGLRLLVALPAPLVRLVLLIRGKPTKAVFLENALHCRGRDANAVEALHVIANPTGTEVVVLA